MPDFTKFSKAIQAQFDHMSKQRLFRVDVDPDLLYETYLAAYPEGTNPIFRQRREFDCSCCRNFIKNIGRVVTIENNKLVTVWDVTPEEYPFDVVAQTMSEFISKQRIANVYLSKESKYGAEFSLELLEDQTTRRWNHFSAVLPRQHISQKPDEALGVFTGDFQVLRRSLEEFALPHIDAVIDLINSEALYRGTEHLPLVKSFRELKQAYDNFKLNDKDLFIWQNLGKGALCRFRNTVIGTLIADLAQGVELEKAVKSFESKVAPANYKRPKALITPRMIESAMETINQLGLESALERRLAKFSDVSVNDVLFVDNSVRPQMVGGLKEDLLKTVKTKPVDVKNALEISIDQFLTTVLPKAQEIQVLVKNKNVGNFMSLTAPVHTNAANLFKWDNNFAWSYDGNIADSDIKRRVKSAGGNVDAVLRCSLGWSNYDDLDIHVTTPSREHIYFGNKGGILDVDMNAGGPRSRTPVENLSWTNNNLRDGKYVVSVNNFAKRESIDVGFTLELEFGGVVQTFTYPKTLGDKATVQCLELTVENKLLVGVKVLDKAITAEDASQDKWGIKTETFVDVTSIVLSPNYWGENQSGNKHWFFILKDCKNPEPIRGIYNEFLSDSLAEHRKVFEIIGEKTKCPVTDEQMSGLGFSSTKRDTLTVKVKSDKTNQTYNIQF